MRVNLTKQELAICSSLVNEHKYDKFMPTDACQMLLMKLENARKNYK